MFARCKESETTPRLTSRVTIMLLSSEERCLGLGLGSGELSVEHLSVWPRLCRVFRSEEALEMKKPFE